MVTRHAITWVLLPALIAMTGACGPKVDDPADIAAIKELPAAHAKALAAGDLDGLMATFADGAFRLGPNQPLVTGKEAIRAGFQRSMERADTEIASTAEDVWACGSLGVARGVYTSKRTPKIPGEAVTDVTGKWLSFYRRQSDGAWKVAGNAWNVDVPVSRALAASSDDELALLQVERDWGAAWKAQDAAALDRILAAEFVESFDGQLTSKAKMLADVKVGVYKVESAEASDMRVIVFGSHAVVNGATTVKQTARGKDMSWSARWTDTFVNRDGRWQAVMSFAVKAQ